MAPLIEAKMHNQHGSKVAPAQTLGQDDLISHLRRIRRFLTTRELSILLRKHPETVYRMVTLGFPAIRDGGRWKFDSLKVADWMEQRTTRTPARVRSETRTGTP